LLSPDIDWKHVVAIYGHFAHAIEVTGSGGRGKAAGMQKKAGP